MRNVSQAEVWSCQQKESKHKCIFGAHVVFDRSAEGSIYDLGYLEDCDDQWDVLGVELTIGGGFPVVVFVAAFDVGWEEHSDVEDHHVAYA